MSDWSRHLAEEIDAGLRKEEEEGGKRVATQQAIDAGWEEFWRAVRGAIPNES
jgi:hypothetical protein